MDKIFIKDLLVRCIIGINESERREKQDVMINVTVWLDITKAAQTDKISETVDYKKISKEIIRMTENSSFFLAETLAEKIAQICLQHEKVKRAEVTVEKMGALRFARSAGVEITRTKD